MPKAPETNQSPNLAYPLEQYQRLFKIAFAGEKPNKKIWDFNAQNVIARNLTELLGNKATTLTSLGDEKAAELVGFSVALPIDKLDPARAQEASETAYIYYTAITPERQGEGLVGSLNDLMIEQLKSEGYSYLEADCLVDTGFADKVEKNYAQAIVAAWDHSDFAKDKLQRFFRIDLSQV